MQISRWAHCQRQVAFFVPGMGLCLFTVKHLGRPGNHPPLLLRTHPYFTTLLTWPLSSVVRKRQTQSASLKGREWTNLVFAYLSTLNSRAPTQKFFTIDFFASDWQMLLPESPASLNFASATLWWNFSDTRRQVLSFPPIGKALLITRKLLSHQAITCRCSLRISLWVLPKVSYGTNSPRLPLLNR